jgi:hypothetical protein
LKIGILTPIASHVNVELFSSILRDWYRLFKKNRKHHVTFYFLAPEGSNAVNAIRMFKARHKLMFFPKDLSELPSLQKIWKECRFVELAVYRNVLMDRAKTDGVDFAIFLDSDVVPPHKAIDCFTEDNRDICGGIVKTLNDAKEFILGFGHFKEPFFSGLIWATEIPKEKLSEVGFVNTACMCISRRVLRDERLRFPIISVPIEGDESRVISEDHAFCHLAKSLGYKIFVDKRVMCQHFKIISEVPIMERFI